MKNILLSEKLWKKYRELSAKQQEIVDLIIEILKENFE